MIDAHWGVSDIGCCPSSTAGVSSGEKASPCFQLNPSVFQLVPLCLQGHARLTLPLVLPIPVADQVHVWPWLSSLPTSTQGCPLELLSQAARCLINDEHW